MKVERIEVNRIKAVDNSREIKSDSEFQNLMDSIKKVGLAQPIGVTLNGDNSYHIAYGHRRFAACRKLGWLTVPAILHDHLTPTEMKVLNIVENIQRVNITPIELGRYCTELRKEGLNLPEIAIRLSYPLHVLKQVMDTYNNLPEVVRSKVRFQKPGKAKPGTIPIGTAAKILNAQRNSGFGQATVTKLANEVKINQLTGEDIKIIGRFIEGGMTPAKAILHQKKFRMFRVDVVAYKDEVEIAAAKVGLPITHFFEAIVFGEHPPMTRPTEFNKKKTVRRK